MPHTCFAIVTENDALDQIAHDEQTARREAKDLADMGLDVKIWTGSEDALYSTENDTRATGRSFASCARHHRLTVVATYRAKFV